MKSLVRFSIFVVFLFSWVGMAAAFDSDYDANVEIVEGVSIAEVSEMDFGQVAEKNGTLQLNTDDSVTDADLISVPAGTPAAGVYTITGIANCPLTAAFTDNNTLAGLELDGWTVSQDGGADEGDLTAIALSAASSTWTIGANLTVDTDDYVAGVGAQVLVYNIEVTLN